VTGWGGLHATTVFLGHAASGPWLMQLHCGTEQHSTSASLLTHTLVTCTPRDRRVRLAARTADLRAAAGAPAMNLVARAARAPAGAPARVQLQAHWRA